VGSYRDILVVLLGGVAAFLSLCVVVFCRRVTNRVIQSTLSSRSSCGVGGLSLCETEVVNVATRNEIKTESVQNLTVAGTGIGFSCCKLLSIRHLRKRPWPPFLGRKKHQIDILIGVTSNQQNNSCFGPKPRADNREMPGFQAQIEGAARAKCANNT
jgi:hypothetical protein